jgi:hypothetical protein
MEPTRSVVQTVLSEASHSVLPRTGTATRPWIGLSVRFGAGFGTSIGAAFGLLAEARGIYPELVFLCAVSAGVVATVPALVAGILMDVEERWAPGSRDQPLKALLLGATIGAAFGFISPPLVVATVPAGILSAGLAVLWSGPLPPIPGEQYLPLRRKWAWYGFSGVLLALPPLLALGLRWWGPFGHYS